jgi:CheY-like chemotaxis protein
MSTESDLILLIDDDISGRAVRKLVLELHHHSVVAVGEPAGALRAIETQPVKLVILDYFLDGTTGTELAREIRRVKPDLPILLLSGSGELPQGVEHVDRYLCKLDSVEVIEKSINELMGRRVSELSPSPTTISATRRPAETGAGRSILSNNARNL